MTDEGRFSGLRLGLILYSGSAEILATSLGLAHDEVCIHPQPNEEKPQEGEFFIALI